MGALNFVIADSIYKLAKAGVETLAEVHGKVLVPNGLNQLESQH